MCKFSIVRHIVAAFQFMTILPLPVATDEKDLQHAMTWFPFTGLLIGLFTGYGYYFLSLVLPGSVNAVLTIFLYLILTRGLHIDGLMDTLDGFLSHRERQEKLRIMKESTVGSFAVCGALVWFFMLFSGYPGLTVTDFIIIPVFTRAAILIMPLMFSYPRESGTGKFFVENVNSGTFMKALINVGVIGTGIYVIHVSRYNEGIVSFLAVYGGALVLSFFIAGWVGFWARGNIGGITGDVVGFTIEVLHLLLVLVLPIAQRFL